jgi:hypothetical protein
MLQAKGVRAIDQQDIDAGVYSIYDVVMPTPGYEVQYPAYTEDKYKELLAEDGLKMGDLQNQKQRDFSLRGNYRKMLLKPKHMSWKLKRYVDKTVCFTAHAIVFAHAIVLVTFLSALQLPLQETDVSLLTTDVPRNNWHSQAEVVERDATALCLTFELRECAIVPTCFVLLFTTSMSPPLPICSIRCIRYHVYPGAAEGFHGGSHIDWISLLTNFNSLTLSVLQVAHHSALNEKLGGSSSTQ